MSQIQIETKEIDAAELTERPTGIVNLCNPLYPPHRFVVLVFICFLTFGSYFCYDNPAALTSTIEDDMNVNSASYSILYSIYSWPNAVLSLIGGYIIDKYLGVRFSAVMFGSFCFLGQIVFGLGGFFGPSGYWVMILGRFIFGLGGECLAVCQNTYSVLWFQGKELNFVFGIQLSVSRVGSTLNMNLMEPIYKMFKSTGVKGYVALGLAIEFGVLLCSLSVLLSFVLWYMDSRAERIKKNADPNSEIAKKEVEEINLKDLIYFPLDLWLIVLICVFFYCAIFPFVSFGILFFVGKYNMSSSQANLLNSVVYLMGAIASPVFGFLVDNTGYNTFWVIGATILTLCSHLLLTYTFLTPWVPVFMMGFGYSSLACSLWPMVAFTVPESKMATAYGIMQSIQNLGLAIAPLVAGVLVDQYGFMMLEIFFVMCVFVALICGVLLYIVNTLKGGKCNRSAKEIKAASKREEETVEDTRDQRASSKSSLFHDSNSVSSQARRASLSRRSLLA